MEALMKTKPGKGNVELKEIAKPVCKPDTIIIEVKFAGICGTDIHIFHDEFPNVPPVVLGHEFSGVVAEVGSEITKFKVGDRVTVNPASEPCGKCEYCKRGYYFFCNELLALGVNKNGGFAKYVEVLENHVYKLPDNVSLEVAALAEPFSCTLQGIEELTTIHAGDVVLLSGPGPIGLLALLLLKLKGCKVIIVGTGADASRLNIAREIGADVVVDLNAEDLSAVVKRETDGRGVDVAVECAGSNSAIANAFRELKALGTFIQIGIVGKEITIDYDAILYKQLKLFGAYCHASQTWDKTMKILEQGKINFEPVITHKLPIKDWEKGFKVCEEKAGAKVLFYFD